MYCFKALLFVPISSVVFAYHHDDSGLDLYAREDADLVNLWSRDICDELDVRDLDDEAGLWSRAASISKDLHVRDDRPMVQHNPAKFTPKQMAEHTQSLQQEYGSSKGLVKDFKRYGDEPVMQDSMQIYAKIGRISKEDRVKDLKNDKQAFDKLNKSQKKADKDQNKTGRGRKRGGRGRKNAGKSQKKAGKGQKKAGKGQKKAGKGQKKADKSSTSEKQKAQKDLLHAAGRKLSQDLAIQKAMKEGKAGPEAKATWEATHGKPKSKLRRRQFRACDDVYGVDIF